MKTLGQNDNLSRDFLSCNCDMNSYEQIENSDIIHRNDIKSFTNKKNPRYIQVFYNKIGHKNSQKFKLYRDKNDGIKHTSFVYDPKSTSNDTSTSSHDSLCKAVQSTISSPFCSLSAYQPCEFVVERCLMDKECRFII